MVLYIYTYMYMHAYLKRCPTYTPLFKECRVKSSETHSTHILTCRENEESLTHCFRMLSSAVHIVFKWETYTPKREQSFAKITK